MPRKKTPNTDKPTRLQKFLSDAGVASRRHAETLIRAGRVLVNERVVESIPSFVDPASDKVVVDGRRVRVQRHDYFIVHKPKGFICTNRDPAGRPRAVDLLPPLEARLVPVGRLDVDSCGLLMMTNDGELAQKLTHPRFGISKVYRVEVKGLVPRDLPARAEKGVYLSDGKARASGVRIVHAARDRSVLNITLDEGRNRQIRRMLARLGHPVKALKRVQIGPLSLRGLPVGAARRLTRNELESLRQAVEQFRPPRVSSPRRGPKRLSARPKPRASATPKDQREARTSASRRSSKHAISIARRQRSQKTPSTPKAKRASRRRQKPQH